MGEHLNNGDVIITIFLTLISKLGANEATAEYHDILSLVNHIQHVLQVADILVYSKDILLVYAGDG